MTLETLRETIPRQVARKAKELGETPEEYRARKRRERKKPELQVAQERIALEVERRRTEEAELEALEAEERARIVAERTAMLGVEIPEVEVPEEPIVGVLQRIYPEMFDPEAIEGIPPEEILPTAVQKIEDLIREDPEGFIENLVLKGRNEDTEALLEALDADEALIDSIFAVPELPLLERMRAPPKDLPTILRQGGVPEAEIKKIQELSELDLDKEEWLEKLREIDPAFQSDALYGLAGRSYAAGLGDVISAVAGVAGWAKQETLRENLLEVAGVLQSAAPPMEVWEPSLATVLDPRYWQTMVTRALPFSLSFIPLALVTAYAGTATAAVWGLGTFGTYVTTVTFGAVGAAVAEGTLEAGATYNEAKNRGFTDAEATEAANSVLAKNVTTLTGINALQFFAAFLPMPLRTVKNLILRGLVTTARVAGRVTITGLTEAGEEILQDIYERQALGEEVAWDDEMKMVAMLGAVMGVGLGGAGDVFTTIQSRTAKALPEDLKSRYDADITALEAQGFTTEQAQLLALDKVAETEEGRRIIDGVIEQVEREETIKVITPVNEVEALAWEHISKQEEVAPEAPLTEALIKEGDEIVTKAEAIEPDNASVIKFRELVNQAKGATGETQRQILIQMEALEGKVRAIAEVPEATLSVDEISKYETRIPLDLIRKDEKAYLDRLTREIEKEGITEPVTIRIREDGSRIVWDGMHRLIVAQNLGIKNIPVKFIGDEGISVKKPPAKPKPPIAPEAKILDDQTETISKLAKEKLMMTEEGKAKPQLTNLMKGLVGKNRISQLTQEEADTVIMALDALEVRYGKPPKIPTSKFLITKEFADKIPLLREIGIIEKVRPTRHVFAKMGLQAEIWKPAFRAETELYEARTAFQKELTETEKLVGKDPERRRLIFRELENPGTVVGLTFNEKRAVIWFRKYFDDWANKLNLPQDKRRTNYVTHIFEEDMARILKTKHPLDPELIKAMDFITPKTIFNPFLQRRLGQTLGLVEDPFRAVSAYASRQLKVFYYEPVIQKIRVYQKYLPPSSAKYLRDFITRMTDRPLGIDREMNQTLSEFADKIAKLPGGAELAKHLNRGNPGGLAAYNFTSALYTLWLGFKPTSAIRNLSQHTLILAETGPLDFANGMKLRFTKEGKDALKESLVWRSRKQAFLPAIDASFASKWSDKFRETALWMFRKADAQNVKDAFLAGYSEAKRLFPDAPRQVWIDRGDEVAADTQYLYTKFNSMSVSQNAMGRVFSMLTTWTENWLELMTKWVSTRPSLVYAEYGRTTEIPIVQQKNWSVTYKAIALYMIIAGLAFMIDKETRLKAWEYTGVSSLNYLADVVGGDFPALQYPGALADLVVGFILGDDRRMKSGWSQLKPVHMVAILRQIENVASGAKDWLTLLFYLKGQDFQIKKLTSKWEKGWEDYPLFEDNEERLEWIRTHPETAGWSDAKIRNQWRIDNPLLEAQMFIANKFSILSSEKARGEVLRLIEEHNIDTEFIDGYDKVFGVDTSEEITKFQGRIGNLEKLVAGEEAEYFTVGNCISEINRLVKIHGRPRVVKDGNALAIAYLEAADTLASYEILEGTDARQLWRQQFPEGEAWLYFIGQVQSFENPKSAEILLGLMKKYNIPPEGIRAFLDDPSKYDELFTQKFELEQKWFDQSTEYENYSNSESPLYIEDKEERQKAREQFKVDNPNWVADMRRIEAIDHGAEVAIVPSDPFAGDDVIVRVGEVPQPTRTETQKELRQLEMSYRGLTASQLGFLVDAWIKERPPDIISQLRETGKRLQGYGYPTSPELLVEQEVMMWGLTKRLGLSNDRAVEIEAELFPLTKAMRQAEAGIPMVSMVEKWVDRGKTIDEFGAGSSEAKVWLLDNPEVHQWALDQELLTDDGSDWNEDVLRINVEMAKLDEESGEYALLKRRKEAHTEGFSEIDNYVAYYQLPVAGYRQERFLLEHPEFAQEMRNIKGLDIPKPQDVPSVKYDELLEKEDKTPEDELRMDAYKKFVPDNQIENYVTYFSLTKPEGVDLWYEDDWFLMEHRDFYKEVYLKIQENERADFRKVPSREVYKKYLRYLDLPQGKRRDDYRWDNRDLDEWLVIKFGYTPITEKRRREKLTPSELFEEERLERERAFEEEQKELEEMIGELEK